MTNIVYYKPKRELTAEINLKNFINHCHHNLTLYEDQGGFSVNKWYHKQKKRSIAIIFSKYNNNSNPKKFNPLDEPFLSFAKAYIRYTQSNKAVSSVTYKVVALRILHDALCEVHCEANVLKINGPTLIKLQELTKLRINNKDRRNKMGYQIRTLINFIRDKQIAPTLQEWVNPWPKVGAKSERTDKESRDWQEKRCPSMHQMLTLADCFAEAKTLEDQYWSSIIVLLMFAPGRAGELSDLTIDCIHYGENGALGFRWYAEKGFGYTIKWVPKSFEKAVLQAYERLMVIGKPARKSAKFANDNPGKFFHPSHFITSDEYQKNQPINALEFAQAMSFSPDTIEKIKAKVKNFNSDRAWNFLGAHTSIWIQKLRENENPTYQQLSEYVLCKYKTPNWPNLFSIERPVFESLVLIRDNEFHNQFCPKEFSWRIPSVNELNTQLSSRTDLKNPPKTIFQRMGYQDEDGTDIRITSHQIRVWLSTNAERGGMDAWQLARWAGRARINDNRHYDLRTQDEREKQARSILEFTERPTALEAIKLNLPVSYKDLGLNRIGIADVTEYGMCTHDYAMSPCTKGGECMVCKEHVCIKGMPKTLKRILKFERQIELQFNKATLDNADNTFGADRWITHLGWKLAHIRTQRERLESNGTPEGTVLWIPPEHDPSPVKLALDQRGFDNSINNKELVDENTLIKLLGVENA